ncbi:MAG TPA: sigma-70 family RNA polymerase sigma factor [Thermodesulfovibrionales bacterium]|nr:sigma-70 family RNA polymerase sigma factor [Thermodesulfovibrionales bacterium]
MAKDNHIRDAGFEFQDIHETFHKKVYRYLKRLVGEQDAEDLTQEVFVNISRSLDTFRGEAKLSTWIYRIATNVARDRLRSPSLRFIDQEESTFDSFEDDWEDRDSWSGEKVLSIDQQLVRKEMNECIRDIIDRLSENYRTVIVLSELEELSNHEIAEILQVSLDTVKIRLHRARERLKKELESHCTFYHNERNELACDRRTSPLTLIIHK